MRYRLRLFDDADACIFDGVVRGREQADAAAPEGVILVVDTADPSYLSARVARDTQRDRVMRADWTPVLAED